MDADESEERRRRAEDETAARKRSRRVSFADTTAVLVYDRDEDEGTPVDSKASNSAATDASEPLVGGYSGVSEDEEDAEDDDEAELFVKDLVDFSPASVAGSATSNDDENLFGPVSTSFINTGRLSEASEDNNHDITLDSTAFSLHFRNVLPLEDKSGHSPGSMRSLTGDSIPDNHESMHIEETKEKASQRLPGEMSGDGTSNFSRMSLITETSGMYDFCKLSPRLKAFLTKVNQSIQPETPNKISTSYQEDRIPSQPNIEGILSSSSSKLASGVKAQTEFDMKRLTIPNPALLSSPYQEANECSDKVASINSICSIMKGPSLTVPSSPPSILNSPAASKPNNLEQPGIPETSIESPVFSSAWDLNINSPLEGPVSSLLTKCKEVCLDPPVLLQNNQAPSPSTSNYSCSKIGAGTVGDHETIAAAKNEISSFMHNKLHDVETVKLRSPEMVYSCSQAGVSSLGEGKTMDVHSDSISSASIGVEEHTRNGDLGTGGRLKFNFEITSQGLLTPINVPKLDSPIDYDMDATLKTAEMAIASGVGSLSAITSKMHTICNEVFTPQSMQRLGSRCVDNFHDLAIFQNLFSLYHTDSSTKKRKAEEVLLKDMIHKKNTGKDQMSSMVLTSNAEVSSQVGSREHGVPSKCWKDIFSKVSGVVKQKLSSPMNLLKLKEIDVFDDMLELSERNRKYVLLCIDIECLRKKNYADHKHRERLTEARILQVMFLYKSIKLMLMWAKHDVLLEKVEKMHAGITEFRNSKSFVSVEKCLDQASASHQHFSAYQDNENPEAKAVIVQKKEELHTLEKKLQGLMKSCQHFSEVNASSDYDAFISLVQEDLNKRRHCRAIRHDLLLWAVDNTVIKDDICVIGLNYCDLLLQSFSIKSIAPTVVSFSNILSNGNIEERFPNMNACVAFEFVFSDMIGRELTDSKYLRIVPQRTNILLRNILDLLEEVQAISLAIPNLVHTLFHISSANQLGLDLCFCGQSELVLTLDTSDLNRGVYPSEPSKLKIRTLRSESTISSPTWDEILSAIHHADSGRLMINKLCRRISDIIGARS